MHVQWGSVADWFAAVGTAGALLLGMVILIRERRKDEQVEATEFFSRFEVRRVDEPQGSITWFGHLYARNIGRSPIYDAALYFPTLSVSKPEASRASFRWLLAYIRIDVLSGRGRIQGIHKAVAILNDASPAYNLAVLPQDAGSTHERRSIKPGEAISIDVKVADSRLLNARGWLLHFTDSHGRRWVRQVGSDRYVSRRRVERILRPLMGVELRFSVHSADGDQTAAAPRITSA